MIHFARLTDFLYFGRSSLVYFILFYFFTLSFQMTHVYAHTPDIILFLTKFEVLPLLGAPSTLLTFMHLYD